MKHRLSGKWIFLLAGAALTGASLVGRLLQQNADGYSISRMSLLLYAIAAPVCAVCLGVLLYFIWLFLTKKCRWTASDTERETWLRLLLHHQSFYLIFFLLCWLPCLLAYYPAIYSYDAQVQLEQWINGIYSAHHPLLHTLLVGVCYEAGHSLSRLLPFYLDGMLLYSLIQMLILAYALARAAISLARKGAADWVLAVYALFFGIFPVNGLLSVTITKDVIFASLLLLQFVLFLEILQEGTLCSFRKKIFFTVVSICMMLFRNNGVYVSVISGFAILLAGFLSRKQENKRRQYNKIAVLLLGTILMYMGCSSLLSASLHAAKTETKEMLSLPLQQLARTYRSNGERLTPEDREEFLYYLPEEGSANYRFWLSDPVKLFFSEEHFMEEPASFFRFYLRMFRKYPQSFLAAGLYQTMGFWHPQDVSHTRIYESWWRDRTCYLMTDAIPVFHDDYVRKENFFPSLRRLYERIATDCIQLHWPIIKLLFTPSFYCWGLLFLIIAAWREKRKTILTAAVIPASYLLTLLAGPCVLVRYIYPLMLIVPFGALYFLLTRKGGA